MTRVDIFLTPPSLEVARYRAPEGQYHHIMVTERSTGTSGMGGGLDSTEAQIKATFEWIERKAFRALGRGTSSGWAAHSSPEAARLNAERELLERDAVLCSWLLRLSPEQLGARPFPAFGASFPLLRFGKGEGFEAIGAVLEAPAGRILISACEASSAEAYAKLLVDSERARWILETGVHGDPAPHHEHFCRMNADSLAWLYTAGTGIDYPRLSFTHELLEAPLWNRSTAWIASASCGELQPLYFGPTRAERLNLPRLRGLSSGPINEELHPLL